MARKPAEVDFADEEELDDDDVVMEQPTIVKDDLRTARIKGTWKMYWGAQSWDFEDGKKYRIPADLYDFLRAYGNIYNTL